MSLAGCEGELAGTHRGGSAAESDRKECSTFHGRTNVDFAARRREKSNAVGECSLVRPRIPCSCRYKACRKFDQPEGEEMPTEVG